MTGRNETPGTDCLEQIWELIGEILRKSSRRDEPLVYRGEPECYAIASSGLYRNCPGCEEETFDIEEVQQEMIENARQYTTLEDAEEILAEVQHFGGLTNLLDFTDDYLIALFFASVDGEGKDGRVILHWPNGESTIRPKPTNNRVVFQKSVFVRPRKGFIVPHPDEETVIVPAALKEGIQAFLERFHGISERTVYNDIHGYIRNEKPGRSRYAAEFRETLDEPGRHPSFDLERDLPAEMDTMRLLCVRHYCHQKEMDYTDGSRSEFLIVFAKGDSETTMPHRLLLYPEEVIELSTHFIATESQCVQLHEAHCWRGHALLFKGLYDEAFNDFRIALELDDQYSEAYHGRANVYRQQEEFDLAAQDLQVALELRPNFPPILIDQGNLQRNQGSLDDAAGTFTGALGRTRAGSQYTWNRDVLFFRAVTSCVQKDWLAAERDFELARLDRLRVASTFRNLFGSVAEFEARYDLKLPSPITTQLYLA